VQPAMWEKNESHLSLMRVIFVFFSRLNENMLKLWKCKKSLWRWGAGRISPIWCPFNL